MAPRDDESKRREGSVSRRDFIKTVGVTSLATSVLSRADAEAQARQPSSRAEAAGEPGYFPIRQEVADNLVKRGIVGYADRLRVEPGQAIRFMVSSELPSYRVDIVRLIHGDPNPDGPGIKEEVMPSEASGDYRGKRQDLPLGSYVAVPDRASLRLTGSFSITTWIAPTTVRPAPGEETEDFPRVGPQGIVTKFSEEHGAGYGLFVDELGRLSLWLAGPGGRVEKLHAEPSSPPVGPRHPGNEPEAWSSSSTPMGARSSRRAPSPGAGACRSTTTTIMSPASPRRYCGVWRPTSRFPRQGRRGRIEPGLTLR